MKTVKNFSTRLSHSLVLAFSIFAILPSCSPRSFNSDGSQGADVESFGSGSLSSRAPTHVICPKSGLYDLVSFYRTLAPGTPPSNADVAFKSHANEFVIYAPDMNKDVKIGTMGYAWVYHVKLQQAGYVAAENMVRLSDKSSCTDSSNPAPVVVNPNPINPNPVQNPGGVNPQNGQGASFASWYLKNYSLIVNTVHDSQNSSSRYVSTALRLGVTLDFPFAISTSALTSELNARGWQFIYPDASQKQSLWSQLQTGDIIATQDGQTPNDGVPNHITIITEVVIPGVTYKVTDNLGQNYIRKLDGSDGKSKIWSAWRVK